MLKFIDTSASPFLFHLHVQLVCIAAKIWKIWVIIAHFQTWVLYFINIMTGKCYFLPKCRNHFKPINQFSEFLSPPLKMHKYHAYYMEKIKMSCTFWNSTLNGKTVIFLPPDIYPQSTSYLHAFSKYREFQESSHLIHWAHFQSDCNYQITFKAWFRSQK